MTTLCLNVSLVYLYSIHQFLSFLTYVTQSMVLQAPSGVFEWDLCALDSDMAHILFLDFLQCHNPVKLFAGTPPIAEAIGLGAAVDYLEAVGMAKVHALEDELGGYLYERVGLPVSSLHIL